MSKVGEMSEEPVGLRGLRRWGIVAAAFLSCFTCFGVGYSFGAFFDSMSEEFNSGKGLTALMFSLTTCFYFLGGLITGRLADRFGPRRVVVVGAISMGIGLYLTSLVQAIWVGFITYGVGVGTATACGYVPMVATVGGWFNKRRTLALGIAVSGIGPERSSAPRLRHHLSIGTDGERRTWCLQLEVCQLCSLHRLER